MAERADETGDDDQRDVDPGHRLLDPRPRRRERHQHGADDRRIDERHPRVLGGELAGQDLERRVEARRRERQQRRAVEDLAAGPHDQQHAEESRGDHRDAQRGQPFAQEHRRQQGDQHRRQVGERRHLGERQELEGVEEAQRRPEQQHAAGQLQRQLARAEESRAHRRHEPQQQRHHLHAPAGKDQQRHRIALGQQLDDGVDQREAQQGRDDQQHGLRRNVALRACGQGGRKRDSGTAKSRPERRLYVRRHPPRSARRGGGFSPSPAAGARSCRPRTAARCPRRSPAGGRSTPARRRNRSRAALPAAAASRRPRRPPTS